MVLTLHPRLDGEAGVIRRRFVTAADIIHLLAAKAAKRAQWWQLWPGVVAVGQDTDGHQRYLVVRPARRTTIRCQVGKRIHRLAVEVPNLLAELIADRTPRGRRWLDISRVWCFRGTLAERTQLHVPPLPNSYRDGRVCMGGINLRSFNKATPAATLEGGYFRSLFTGHALDQPLTAAARKRYGNVVEMVRRTRGKVSLKDLVKVCRYDKILETA